MKFLLQVLWVALLLAPCAFGKRVRDDLEADCVPANSQPPKGFSFFPDDFKLENEDGKPAVDVEIAEDFSVEYGPNFKVCGEHSSSRLSYIICWFVLMKMVKVNHWLW